MIAWTNIPLSEIAPAKGNPLPPNTESLWNLSLEDIEPHTGKLLTRKSCPVSELGSTKCSFDERHVLYSKLRPYLNKVVVPDADGVGTSELIPFLPDADRLNREYLAYYLRSPAFQNFANANTRGANLPRIAMDELWRHQVPVPESLPEQRRIVARIKDCMERVEEIEHLRTEASKEAQATFPSLLSSAFDELSTHYPMVEIGQMARETRYGTSRKCSSKSEGNPILRIPNVIKGAVNFDNLKYCTLDRSEVDRMSLEDGDLLFVRTNGSRELVGRCAIFSQPKSNAVFGFASYLIRLRLDVDQMRPQFLAFFLNSTHGRTELNKRRRTSAGQFNINSENLRSIKVPLPPTDVQDSLIATFKEQEEEIVKLHQEMLEAQSEESQLRDSILRKAFAGEL